MKITGFVGVLAIGLAATAAVTFSLTKGSDDSSAKADVGTVSTEYAQDAFFSGIVLGEEGVVPFAPEDTVTRPRRSLPQGMEWIAQTPPVDVDGIGLKSEEGVFVGVVLPYDTREGDQVSTVVVAAGPPGEGEASFEGMIIVDPQGKKHDVVPGDVITFVAVAAMTWSLLGQDGNQVAETQYDLTDKEARTNEFQEEPIVARSNQVIDIPGEFNGDMSDTKVTIGGQEATVIAENPRGVIFAVPDLGEQVGEVECIVEEAGVEHEIPMVSISLSIEGPRTMRLGQSANLTVTIHGLGMIEDMPEGEMVDSIYIKYRNDTAATISFPNHNLDSHPVDVSKIKDGSYTFEIPFTAEAPGSYVVKAWSWTYLASSYGPYCTGRQCCLITCGVCTEGWFFCNDEGTVNCTRVNKRKVQCGKCDQNPCSSNHSGGNACGHWWCNCDFGKCSC